MTTTKLEDLLREMEAMGSEQTRKTYRRHGGTDPMFGVSFANFYKIQKRIKTDHELARQLWASGNLDARILATMIAAPGEFDASTLEAWLNDCDNYGMIDAFATMAGGSPVARELMEKWTPAPGEWRARAGWRLLAHLAMHDESLGDGFFKPYLKIIEREVHTRPNRVRDAMNSALIAIGIRNPALEKLALGVAAKIGKLEVDHGPTACKTPDATEYIRKTLAHRQQQLEKQQQKLTQKKKVAKQPVQR